MALSCKVIVTSCYLQLVVFFPLNRFNIGCRSSTLRQSVQPVTAVLQPVQVRPQFFPRRAV